jgi:hypothetical protein
MAEAGSTAGTERASAASARRMRAALSKTMPQSVRATPRSLAEVEAWMVSAIVSRDDPAVVGAVVTDGPRLLARERFEIYRSGYRSRLVECLEDDYPVLAASLGARHFEALCSGYIERYPSTSPSLNAFGRHMARFCRESVELETESAAIMGELAELEWALVEAIHAETPPPFDPKQLEGLPAETWGDVRFIASPAVRLLRFEFPMNAYYQAHRTGKNPEVPGRARSATAVYRRGLTVWRMDLTPAMTRVLDALLSGAPLGEALARIGVDETDPLALAEAERSVMVWFREWVSAGFFVDIVSSRQ